jgi:hypothetical protein
MTGIADLLALVCFSDLQSWLVHTPLTQPIIDLGCSPVLPIALDIVTTATRPLLFQVLVLAETIIHDRHHRLSSLGVLLWFLVVQLPLTQQN